MTNKRMEFLIGMTVLTVFVTIIVMTILFGSQHNNLLQFTHGEKMTILFDKAPGIRNTSRVTKSGVEIGRVYSSELVDGEQGTQVRVHFSMNDPKTKIYSNERARINKSIIGEAEIEFVKNKDYRDPVRELTSEDTIVGISGEDLMGTVSNIEGDLSSAIQSVNMAAQEAAHFIQGLNNFMGTESEIQLKKERLENIFKELGDTLQTTRNLANNMNEIISDPQIRENIRTTSSDLPDLMAKVNSLLDNAGALSDSISDTINRSQKTFDKVDRSLDDIGDFTGALSEEGPEFISNLNASSKDISVAIKNISELSGSLTKQINNHSTPLGMLTDEKVGDSLRATISNVQGATEKIHPILDDARVFSNKIAHKPSSLIWDKKSYKGEPTLSDRHYNFQSYSPAGGTGSSLFTPSRSYYQSMTGGYQPFASGYGYGSLESYRGAYGDSSSTGWGSNNCVSRLLERCRGGKNSEEIGAGYVTDPAEYYGLESAPVGVTYAGQPMTTDGASAMIDPSTLNPGEYLTSVDGAPGIGGRSGCLGKTCALKTAGNLDGGMRFSLASAFKKVFHKGDDVEEIYPEAPATLGMNVVYQTGDWSTDGMSGYVGDCAPNCAPETCAPDCAPNCAPETCAPETCGPEGCGMNGYPVQAPGSLEMNSNGLTFPTENAPGGDGAAAPVFDRGETPDSNPVGAGKEKSDGVPAEVLPESAVKKPVGSYSPSPLSPEYGGNGASNLSNRTEIPLGPAPKRNGNDIPLPDGPLPAPVNVNNPSTMPPTTPKTSQSTQRSFVDDGLPIQFTPNH